VPINTQIGNVIFDETIEVTWLSENEPFTRPGDSGSIIFLNLNGDRVAIGLHFAGGTKKGDNSNIGVSYSCDLFSTLQQLEAEWWEE
jgi:V8-like Glu-specific endopeptidase